MDLLRYIKLYAKNHNIERYALKSKVLYKSDLANPVPMSGGVGFFYDIYAIGQIANYADLSKFFLIGQTNTDFWDFTKIVKIQDFNTVQAVNSDFIFTVENEVRFNLYEGTADAMFQSIINVALKYMYLTPVIGNGASDGDERHQVNLKFDY